MLSIAVVAYNRFNYLSICLESIVRLHGLDDCDLAVYFDGKLSGYERYQAKKLLLKYPTARYCFSRENRGIRGNLMNALRTEFVNGADEVLYLEDDHIISPSAIEYLKNVPRDSVFVSLGGTEGENVRQVHYRAKGNMIGRNGFDMLERWVKSKKWVGKLAPGRTKPLDADATTHDAVFSLFVEDTQSYSRLSPFPYVAHFGIFGVNFPLKAATEEDKRLEAAILKGPQSQWLDNVLHILNNGEYSDDIRLRLWPRGFRNE